MSNDTNNPGAPRDKADLLNRIEQAWAALQQTIGQVTEAQMTVPDAGGWSIKDNLAHLTAWEEFVRLAHVKNLQAHAVLQIDEKSFQQLDEAGINAIIQQRNKDRSVAAVLADLQRTHAQVLAELEQWSYVDLMQPRDANDPEASPIINLVIANTYEHYQEHQTMIQKLVKQGQP